jgi:hypothetical protein
LKNKLYFLVLIGILFSIPAMNAQSTAFAEEPVNRIYTEPTSFVLTWVLANGMLVDYEIIMSKDNTSIIVASGTSDDKIELSIVQLSYGNYTFINTVIDESNNEFQSTVSVDVVHEAVDNGDTNNGNDSSPSPVSFLSYWQIFGVIIFTITILRIKKLKA